MARDSLLVPEETGVGNRVRLARMAAQLSRKEVARRLGLSMRTFDRIESGQRDLTPREAYTLAAITGQDVTFFGLASQGAGDGTVSGPDSAVKRDNADALNGALTDRARDVIEEAK